MRLQNLTDQQLSRVKQFFLRGVTVSIDLRSQSMQAFNGQSGRSQTANHQIEWFTLFGDLT